MKDQFGLSLSCATAYSAQAFNHFANKIIELGSDLESILVAVKNEPAVPMLQLCEIMFYLFDPTKLSI